MTKKTTSRKLVLLLSSDSGEGSMGSMIDPILDRHFKKAGIDVRAAYLSDLKPSWLAGVHAVIILRGPIPGHPIDDLPIWKAREPALQRFVEKGGGLVVMDTECYGKTVGPLNDLLEPWNLRLRFNDLVSPSAKTHFFPRFIEGRVVPFAAAVNSPVEIPGGTLDLLVEGGHGSQHYTCEVQPGPIEWQTVLQGDETVVSRHYATTYVNSSDEDSTRPVACVVADVGKGRVAAFPGAAPFWIVNPYIWRFEGRLLEQHDGAGRRFLIHLIQWVTDTARNRRLNPERTEKVRQAITPELLMKPERFSFRTVSEAQKKAWLASRPRKVWIGESPLTQTALRTQVKRCVRDGYAAIMPMTDYDGMTESRWSRAVTTSEKLTDELDLPVWPGLDSLDGEGMHTVSYTTGPWPNHRSQYPNSTLLEAVWLPYQGSAAILRSPLHNRLPPQRYGGFNLLEWESDPEWFALYRRMIASKQFLSPIAIRSAGNADAPDTWVLNPRADSPLEGLRRSRHQTFVSNGPKIIQFAFEDGEWIDDEWEGHWLSLRPGDTVSVRLHLVAEAPLRHVTLWDGEEVLAEFTPGSKRWNYQLRFRAWRDLALHLTAEDEQGRKLYASYPLYTRNPSFWGHVGGDNMNNYVNAMRPARHGFLGVGERDYEPYGFVTLGQAWGDYLRIAPALPYADFMPRQEISFTLGSFREHHPSAWLWDDAGRLRYLNDHRRVFAFCGADGQHYVDQVAGEQADNDDQALQTWHGREVCPTRILRDVPGVACRDEYFIWRWEPRQPIVVEVEKRIQFTPGQLKKSLVLASNTHQAMPGLCIQTVDTPVRRMTEADLPETPFIESHKEWDNTHYARRFAPGAGAEFLPGKNGVWQVGHGGVGTLMFTPLDTDRPWSLRVFRTEKEWMIFIQTEMTDEECRTGEVCVRYLLAVDASEEGESVFRNMIRPIRKQKYRWSLTLDLNDKPFPRLCKIPAAYRASESLHLVLKGLPSGIYTARDERGRRLFTAQPLGGCSMHILHEAIPDKFTLSQSETLKEAKI